MWRTHGSPERGLLRVAVAAALGWGGLLLGCSGDSTGIGENLLTVATVTVDPATMPPRVLAPGATAQLAAVAKTAAGDVVNVTFTWTSNNTAVATVTNTGLVTARAAGVVTITATAQQKSGSTAIVVAVPGTQVVVEPAAASVDVGATLQLKATVIDASGNALSWPVTFSSQNPAAATVSPSGLVTGVALGEATIVAAAEGVFGAARITVETAVASVDLAPTTSVIAVDDTVQFTATPKDAAGKAVNRPVTWGSSNTAVATVDAQGRVVGTGVGSVEITASAGSQQGKGRVDVQAKVASVTITAEGSGSGSGGGSGSVAVGSTLQLVATVKDADGNVLDRTVTWSSSAATIASVDQAGLVTGVAPGDAVITAAVQKVSGTYEVKVTGEVTTTGNNMSVPVDFAEGIGLTLLPLATETGMRPLAAEGITADTTPFFYSGNVPDCGTVYYCQAGANTWQAQWLDGSSAMQSATVAWGDNLVAKNWTSTSMIRVEVRLTRADTTLLGFNMPYVINPSSPDEMQGTDGTTALMVPNIFAVTSRLIVEKLDDSHNPVWEYFNGSIAEGTFTVEVNVSGNVAYGYNFQLKNVVMPSGLLKTGWWRLTFMLDPSATVGGATVNRNVSLDAMAACEGVAVCQLDTANQTSTIDIQIVE